MTSATPSSPTPLCFAISWCRVCVCVRARARPLFVPIDVPVQACDVLGGGQRRVAAAVRVKVCMQACWYPAVLADVLASRSSVHQPDFSRTHVHAYTISEYLL